MFNASVYVSEQLNVQLVNMSMDLVDRCIRACAEHYNFDGSEAVRLLGLSMLKVERKAPVKRCKAVAKVSVPKPAFPLPYNGELNESYCYALRQNNGLYTQCTGLRKGEAQFCKGCATLMQKTGAEVPEYGTIQQRQAVDIFNYIDPKGRKPVAYTKVMKKYKITEEQVLEEAGKFNIIVNSNHFVVPDTEGVKRGRPKIEKVPKEKGAKGRPKKEKKVIIVDGEEDEDLFATLVANSLEDIPVVSTPKKPTKTDEEREAERLDKEQAKLAEKEAKRLAAENAKKEKEEKLAAEKQAKLEEKALKKEAERLAREEKKKAEEQEKLAKKEAVEKAKAEKLAAKEQKKTSKPESVAQDEEEPDVVKKVEFEGKKYLKSKKSGIIYDYNDYVKNGEQVVIGKWNDNTNKIDFTAAAEEEEEEEEQDEYEE